MNPNRIIIILGLIALALIISLLLFQNPIYNPFVLITIFIIAIIMFSMRKTVYSEVADNI